MIVFNGIEASELGLLVTPFSLRTKAAQHYELTEISGRSAPVVEKNGMYDMVKISVECDLLDCSKIDQVYSWLSGKGILLDSREPDKYRIAEVFDEITVTPFGDDEGKMVTLGITFVCEPFLYKVNDSVFTWTQENMGYDENTNRYYLSRVISTDATVYCEPQIIIDFKFMVGLPLKIDVSSGETTLVVTIPKILTYEIVIDCSLKQIYYEDSSGTLKPIEGWNIVSGKFPTLAPRKYGETGYNANFRMHCYYDDTSDDTPNIYDKDAMPRIDFVKLKCNVRYL